MALKFSSAKYVLITWNQDKNCLDSMRWIFFLLQLKSLSWSNNQNCINSCSRVHSSPSWSPSSLCLHNTGRHTPFMVFYILPESFVEESWSHVSTMHFSFHANGKKKCCEWYQQNNSSLLCLFVTHLLNFPEGRANLRGGV